MRKINPLPFVLAGLSPSLADTYVAQDQLAPVNFYQIEINGFAGHKLDACIAGVMDKKHKLYTKVFRDKLDKGGLFAGEFWGKWFSAAALAYSYQPSPEYRAILDRSVENLLQCQEADGRISAYPREESFVNWDIWGRKYVLLGLVGYYDQTGDAEVLDAACRALDELIDIAGPGKQKLTETGLKVLGSMSSTSILEPVVLLYQRTGKKEYLDFAEHIAALFSEPNAYTDRGMRLVEDALAGVPPVSISSPKAYEIMSCYEGLCELYRATGNPEYKNTAVAFGESLIEREIMVVGSGSSSELWCDGAFRQTELLEQPMETCVTVTWMKFCYQLLKLTGDPKWADQLETTLYNAMAGAMAENGRWWAYYSPLAGERMPSPMQMPVCQSSCCVASGPRGLLTTPGWSVMADAAGPVVNLYAPGCWAFKSPKGRSLKLTQETTYPEGDHIEIGIHFENGGRRVAGAPKQDMDRTEPRPPNETSEEFTLSLRIPAWSKKSEISVNGESVEYVPGDYARITRTWKDGDKIGMKLDLRGRLVRSPGNMNALAVMRGPVVLALDSRMVEKADYNLWLYPENTEWTEQDEWGGAKFRYVLPQPIPSRMPDTYIELKPVKEKPSTVWMAFEVPFLFRYTHFFEHEIKSLVLCDYASAGNEYSAENLFRTWLPQPMFMGNIFPENTWRILHRESDTRPVFPDTETQPESESAWNKAN